MSENCEGSKNLKDQDSSKKEKTRKVNLMFEIAFLLKKKNCLFTGCQWLASIILAIWESEVRRIIV
jgi:hypothetical protein